MKLSAKSSYDFPPLYDFDNYDKCLQNSTSKFESTYCMVYAEIKPHKFSKLWQKIAQHKEEYKFHYKRDRLLFGVCMERCKNLPNYLEDSQNDTLINNEVLTSL